MNTKPYWLRIPPLVGEKNPPPEKADIVIIGSGLSGVSAASFLQEKGFQNILLVDDEPEKGASFRNAGHILYGTVESMKALSEIHGEDTAREIWEFSIELCHEVRETIRRHHIGCDYKQDGYLVIAVSEVENEECLKSIRLLNRMGFQSEYWDPKTVRELGFKNVFGARFEKGSAQAHPVKFRNALLKIFLERGGKYHSGVKVTNVAADSHSANIITEQGGIAAEACVIAANAYSPLFCDFFRARGLIDPFRGQILTSAPLTQKFAVTYPHSFDHGYEYALLTEDNRLLIGGWRDHSSTKEVGTYSLAVNPYIEQGLKDFAKTHYDIDEEFRWDYSWSGIMAASKTGFPFIGPTNSDRIFALCGYTGHGFSWAHGSAKLLAKIISGEAVPEVARFFNPKGLG